MGDFTIADVLAWARTKPADETYDFGSNTNCAICQFLRETRRAANPSASFDFWNDWSVAPYAGVGTPDQPIPKDIRGALMGRTFGGLVERLEKLCPETVVTPSEWTKLGAYLAETVEA